MWPGYIKVSRLTMHLNLAPLVDPIRLQQLVKTDITPTQKRKMHRINLLSSHLTRQRQQRRSTLQARRRKHNVVILRRRCAHHATCSQRISQRQKLDRAIIRSPLFLYLFLLRIPILRFLRRNVTSRKTFVTVPRRKGSLFRVRLAIVGKSMRRVGPHNVFFGGIRDASQQENEGNRGDQIERKPAKHASSGNNARRPFPLRPVLCRAGYWEVIILLGHFFVP